MSKTIEISRELAQKVDDLLYILTGHDSHPKMIRKYGEEFWIPIDQMRDELCSSLAAPAVERQEPVAWIIQWGSPIFGFAGHREVVLTPPDLLSNSAVVMPLYTSPPAPVAVALPTTKELRELVTKAAREADLIAGANYYTAAELAAGALFDKVKEMNQ